MWKNTNPCNVSLDNTSDSEEPVNTTMTTTSIRSEDDSNATQDSVATTPTFMSEENNETWYDTNEEYDLWHNGIETMDNYQEWVDSPMTDKSGYQFLLSMLCNIICFMLLCTFQARVTTWETFVCVIKTFPEAVVSMPIAIYKWFNKPWIQHTKKHCKTSNEWEIFS